MAAVEQKEAPNTEASSHNSGGKPTNGQHEDGKENNWNDKPIMVARNKKGTVKWFSFKNGYGFITVDDDGDDIFVHRSEFIKEGAREVFYHIEIGDKVEFDIINRAKGREAVAVTGPNGMRIPGSPANYHRRRFNRDNNREGEQRPPRAQIESDQYEDAVEEPNHPNGNSKKRPGRGGGGRRRTASGDGQEEQPQGNEQAGGDPANKGARGGRKGPRKSGRGGRGPRADGEQQNNGNGEQENVAPAGK